MQESEVQLLLEEDRTKCHRSYLLLRSLRPSTPDCFDLAAKTYETVSIAFDASDYERRYAAELENVAGALGIGLRELDRRIELESNSNEIINARTADRRLIARQCQKYAFQLAWRSFRWAATDLRRLRLSTVYGFQRQQAEAVGLMALFEDEPEIAVRWFQPWLNQRQLFSQIQPKVKSRLDRFELRWAYDHGSATSMHSTFAAGAAGSRFSAAGNHHVTVRILDDEVNEADPCVFHLAAGSLLRTQQRVLKAVMTICPDVAIEPSANSVESFSRAVEEVWWTLNRRYGNRIAGTERRLGLARPK